MKSFCYSFQQTYVFMCWTFIAMKKITSYLISNFHKMLYFIMLIIVKFISISFIWGIRIHYICPSIWQSIFKLFNTTFFVRIPILTNISIFTTNYCINTFLCNRFTFAFSICEIFIFHSFKNKFNNCVVFFATNI